MRDVREQRTERDHELDLEVTREVDDEGGEPAPAQVRLDAEQQNRVALGPGDPSVVKSRVGPFDPPGLAVDQRDVWTGRLEVEELLAVDLREAGRAPRPREEAPGQRRP